MCFDCNVPKPIFFCCFPSLRIPALVIAAIEMFLLISTGIAIIIYKLCFSPTMEELSTVPTYNATGRVDESGESDATAIIKGPSPTVEMDSATKRIHIALNEAVIPVTYILIVWVIACSLLIHGLRTKAVRYLKSWAVIMTFTFGSIVGCLIALEFTESLENNKFHLRERAIVYGSYAGLFLLYMWLILAVIREINFGARLERIAPERVEHSPIFDRASWSAPNTDIRNENLQEKRKSLNDRDHSSMTKSEDVQSDSDGQDPVEPTAPQYVVLY